MQIAVVSMHTSPLAMPGGGDAGGLNVFVDQTSRALVEQGAEVHVFTRGETATVHVMPGYTVHTLAAGPASTTKEDLPALVLPFAQRLAEHPAFTQASIVHSHYWLSALAAEQALGLAWQQTPPVAQPGAAIVAEPPVVDRPLVHTFHTTAARKQHHGHTLTAAEAERDAAERRMGQRAAALTANTASDRDELCEDLGLDAARVSVVRPGIDAELFTPDGPSAAWPLSSPGLKMLFAGRFQDYKGPHVAIDVLGELHQRGAEASLVMVGDQSGPRTMNLQARAVRLGVADRISVLPPMPHRELSTFYRSADVVLVPSRHETFGLVAAEALASGTPVVGHAAGGLVDLIDHGVDGLLIRSRAPEDWADALELWAHRGVPGEWQQAAAEHGKHLSWDHTAAALMRLYSEVSQTGPAKKAVAGTI